MGDPVNSYGGAIMSDSGLIASSDYVGFSFYERVTYFVLAGNVRTFTTSCPTFPAIFIKAGQGVAFGILSVRKNETGYLIDIISDGSCELLIFKQMSDEPLSGYGIAFLNADGKVTYISNKKMLALNSIGVVSSDSQVLSVTGDCATYSAANLLTESSASDEWVQVSTGVGTEYVKVSNYTCEYVPVQVTKYGFRDTTVFECGYVPGWDGTPSFSCYNKTVSQFTSWTETEMQLQCGNKETMQFVTYITYTSALVRTTSWKISRGCVYFNGASLTFRWVLHKDGFYKDIINSMTTTTALTGGGAVVSPTLSIAEINAALGVEAYRGELARGNVFPYSNGAHNTKSVIAGTLLEARYV